VLGCLLPATSNPAKDLEIFLKLMGMDDAAFLRRGLIPKPAEIVSRLMSIAGIDSHDAARLFVIKRRVVEGKKPGWIEEALELDAFHNLVENRSVYLDWDACIGDAEREVWRLRALHTYTYDEKVKRAKRPEECEDTLLDVIWPDVNDHVGTSAASLPEFIEQLGIARFGSSAESCGHLLRGGFYPLRSGSDWLRCLRL
jgi:putative DNA methylase